MPQEAWSAKRERQYKHIVASEKKEGRSTKRAKEIAARTVNKTRAQTGEAKESSRLSRKDMSPSRRGGQVLMTAGFSKTTVGQAVERVAGPGGLASSLRRKWLDARLTAPSMPLDIGSSETVPANTRNAGRIRLKMRGTVSTVWAQTSGRASMTSATSPARSPAPSAPPGYVRAPAPRSSWP